jgi:hypothetical protein
MTVTLATKAQTRRRGRDSMMEDTIEDFEPIVILNDVEWATLGRSVARTVSGHSYRSQVRSGQRSVVGSQACPATILPLALLRSPVPTSLRRLITHECAPQGDLYPFGFALRPFLAASA